MAAFREGAFKKYLKLTNSVEEWIYWSKCYISHKCIIVAVPAKKPDGKGLCYIRLRTYLGGAQEPL